jgi:hypothetical protein
MKKAEYDLYKLAYGLALDQAPDIEQMKAASEVMRKHLDIYSATLRKAMTPLQVLLTADYDKSLMGYRRIDLDENLDVFMDLEERVNSLSGSISGFVEFLGRHQEGMKVIEQKLAKMEVGA